MSSVSCNSDWSSLTVTKRVGTEAEAEVDAAGEAEARDEDTDTEGEIDANGDESPAVPVLPRVADTVKRCLPVTL